MSLDQLPIRHAVMITWRLPLLILLMLIMFMETLATLILWIQMTAKTHGHHP
jgi:hypothetical protein